MLALETRHLMHSPVNSPVAPSSKYSDRLTLHDGWQEVTRVYGFYGQPESYSARSNFLNIDIAAVSVPVVPIVFR